MSGPQGNKSEDLVSHIPSFGLADLAMRLAEERVVAAGRHEVEGFWTLHECLPCDRDQLKAPLPIWQDPWPISREYYAIIDRIARGEAP